jgi:hypothetical protein
MQVVAVASSTADGVWVTSMPCLDAADVSMSS